MIKIKLRKKDKVSASTRNLHRNCLSSLFQYLENVSYVEKNPVKVVKQEKVTETFHYKVLSHEQIQKYNTFINQKKLEFEERNDNISKLLSTLNLSNEQEFEILKSDKEFKRALEDLQGKNISNEDFMKQYDDLKNVRNKAIMSILTNEQLNILENNNFNK